jgi:hypothetical protein
MPTDIKQGMRRIGLAFGIFGGIAGGFVGYLFYSDIHAQALRSQSFRELAASPAIAALGNQAGYRAAVNPQPVHRDGIAAIHFATNDVRDIPPAERIDWIETEGGVRVYRTDEPAPASYVLVSICPLLGFLLPWGIIRGVASVLLGFMESQEG